MRKDKFNSIQEVLEFIKNPSCTGDFVVRLDGKDDVETLREALHSAFPTGEIEYVYQPNKVCRDRFDEWVQTFHYFRVIVPLNRPFIRRYTFNLLVKNFID